MELHLFSGITLGWRDILDICIITLIFHQLIRMVKETRAVAAIYGLGIIVLAYIASRLIGLNTLNWLLEYILSSMFLIVVIVFQKDIRQALTSIGARRWVAPFFKKKRIHPSIPMICDAAEYMASKKIGALIVIERNVPLGDTMERGVRLDADLSKELLINLFWPNSPLHDGAVMVKNDKIAAAGCILPLSTAITKRDYGTRHRAALGITEETDAVVVTVSEERGAIAVAAGGKLTGVLTKEKLGRVLESALEKTA